MTVRLIESFSSTVAQPESQRLCELRQPQCHKGTVWNALLIQVKFLRFNYCNAAADAHSVKRFLFSIPFEWSLMCPEGQTSVLHLTVVHNISVFSLHSSMCYICYTWWLSPPPPILSLANTNLKVYSGICGSRHQRCFYCSKSVMSKFRLRFILCVIYNANELFINVCPDV